MKRIAAAAFILFTLQLSAGISQNQTNKTAQGLIEGRVTDETGKPVVGVPVQALQYAIDAAGERKLQQILVVRTDDRGDYRLFELAPGRYYIVVGDVPERKQDVEPGGASDPKRRHYVFRFYPGVGDITQATALEIFSGDTTRADMRAVPE